MTGRKGQARILVTLPVSLLVPVIFFLVGLSTLQDYGNTTDETHDRHLGSCNLDAYPAKGHQGLLTCMDDLERNYGPFFAVVVVSSHRLLNERLDLGLGPNAGYHLPVLLVSSLLIWALFLFIFQEAGLLAALLAALCLALMPRFIAHSQANLKDIPTAFFFTLSLMQYRRLLQNPRVSSALLAGLFLGLTYCIKINALLVPAIVGVWMLPRLRSMTLRHWGALALSGGAAMGVVPIFWPYYRVDFLSRFKETYELFIAHDWVGYVLYLGQHYRGPDVPWHYPYVMLALSTPLVILLFAAVSLLWAANAQVRGITPQRRNLIWILGSWALIPCLVQSLTAAPMYDGVRHYMTVLPPLAALASLGMVWAGRRVAELWRARPILAAAAYALCLSLCLGDLLWASVRLHPYQVVFFNSLAGGTKGAYGRFDLDYWGFSYKEAGQWIARNAPPSSVIYVPYTVFQFPHTMGRHSTTQDPGIRWDYKVVLIRGMLYEFDRRDNYLKPSRAPAYSVKAGGATLLRIFDQPGRRRVPAGTSIPPLPVGEAAPSQAFQVQAFHDEAMLQPVGRLEPQRSLGFDCQDNPFRDKPIRVKFSAVLRAPSAGTYCFTVRAEDHGLLRINGLNVVGIRGGPFGNQVQLERGEYRVELLYYNQALDACLDVRAGKGECKGLPPLTPPLMDHRAAAAPAPDSAP